MTDPSPPARLFYLGAGSEAVLAMFHAARDGASADTAVLICPPWGWDEIASYRSRRAWAEHLAHDGHPVLRIDFPGSGDSAGTPCDPARLAAWSRAVVAATTWLAGSTDTARVAVIGLGLGGLVAGQAIADGAPIDDLVLWATPPRGRSFLRHQRAFGKLQVSRFGPTGETQEMLPDGSQEIGGFVLSVETIAAIERLDLGEIDLGRLQRALLLDRDGIAVDAGLQGHLEAAGVEVSLAPGDGWEAMCFQPEDYRPPHAVFGRVSAWLSAAPQPVPTRPVPVAPPTARDRADLVVDGARIRETPLAPDEQLGRWFGFVAEPVDGSRSDLCAIFLNAGAIRRIGPNRMWVEASRRWAATGVSTFRVDVEGLGEAEGDAGMYADVGRFYTPERGVQVTSMIDALEARGFGPRFVLIGLCAGAYAAFNIAAADARVVAALVVNPRALVWDPGLLGRRDARLVKRVVRLDSWRRILRGETDAGQVLSIGRAAATQAGRAVIESRSRIRDRGRVDPFTAELERTLDRLRDTRTRVVLAFSGDEPVRDELEAAGVMARLDRWPNVVLTNLPGQDHTLRPIVAQRALHDLIDRERDRLLGGTQV